MRDCTYKDISVTVPVYLGMTEYGGYTKGEIDYDSEPIGWSCDNCNEYFEDELIERHINFKEKNNEN